MQVQDQGGVVASVCLDTEALNKVQGELQQTFYEPSWDWLW